ncbi:MAG: hypothetical protein JSR80_02645 [Verrucomicrobia bacterium]|nr:hypothetical protein [Verrucomicrobiota bacterium]
MMEVLLMRFLLRLVLFLCFFSIAKGDPHLKRNICGDYVSEAYIREKSDLCPLEDLERMAPYFPLIPKPFKATGGICWSCGPRLCTTL